MFSCFDWATQQRQPQKKGKMRVSRHLYVRSVSFTTRQFFDSVKTVSQRFSPVRLLRMVNVPFFHETFVSVVFQG